MGKSSQTWGSQVTRAGCPHPGCRSAPGACTPPPALSLTPRARQWLLGKGVGGASTMVGRYEFAVLI